MQKQAGIVLITVMLIFAATTLLIVSLQLRFVSSAQLMGAIALNSQLRAFHHGAELQAGLQLQLDAFEDQKQAQILDHYQEAWASPQTYPIEGGEIKTQLIDLQGRLNLTGIELDQKRQEVFIRLLEALNIPANDEITAINIRDILLDWIDKDQEQRGFFSAEDDYYTSLGRTNSGDRQGYITGEGPLKHVSELLLLRGLTKADYVKLSKHVVFLTADAKININTVTLPVAQALNPTAGFELVSNRPSEGFNAQDLASLSENQRPQLQFGIDSQYFELRVEVSIGDVISRQVSMMYRPPAQGTNIADLQSMPQPIVLERDTGWSYYYSL